MLLLLDLILEHNAGLASQVQHKEEYVPNNKCDQGYDGATCTCI